VQTPAEPPLQRKSEGAWQPTSFANLVRYVPSGTYFARLRVAGKLIRRSPQTDVPSVARLRLQDLEKAERSKAEQGKADAAREEPEGGRSAHAAVESTTVSWASVSAA
jgi:hypothetical protein